ncbi:hypothetical protein [Streptomyces sp. NPDC056160]|uniref:hypothetical protein n=1 Tax=Streptomyces sp. NPDC056160 TaxID=3345731 RepID=UPI0035E16ADD
MERTQPTDPPQAPTRYGRAHTASLVRQMLLEMAGRLETQRPAEPITVIGREALIQATTMDPVLIRALRDQVPEIPVSGSTVRTDFARQLRTVAAGGDV